MNPATPTRRAAVMLRLAVLLGSGALAAPHVRGADGSARAVVPDVEVTEWIVLVCDPFRTRANSGAAVGATLPPWVNGLRPPAAAGSDNGPSPIGVIRFTGRSDQTFTVRLATRPGGVFYAAWPPARVRAAEVVWRDVGLTAAPRRLVPMDRAHWLTQLRDAAGPYLTVADRSEKFLLYDAEFPFPPPLWIGAAKADVAKTDVAKTDADAVQVGNTDTTPLHDLVLYRPPRDGSGWASGGLANVPPAPPGSPKAPPGGNPVVQFSPATGDPAQFLAADWKARLAASGLDPVDVDLIVRLLRAHALDDRQTTAVYRLDRAKIDALLPLEITPPPARVRRVALVVVRNIDPDLPKLIDQLITQLGDPDWRKREAASRLLGAYAPAADAKLRTALRNPDQEIVLRAERLLARGVDR